MKLGARYEATVARARSMHHTVKLMVLVGEPENGDPLTYQELPGEPAVSLSNALDKIDKYLDSPAARVRSDKLLLRKVLTRRLERDLAEIARLSSEIDEIDSWIDEDQDAPAVDRAEDEVRQALRDAREAREEEPQLRAPADEPSRSDG